MIGKIQFIRSLLLSWKTSRKIVIIESDDWGSERIPNSLIQRELQTKGVDMFSNPHSRFDTLESLEDLIALENTLDEVNTKFHKLVKITTNFITANPDYHKIKECDYREYFFEPFTLSYFNRDSNQAVINQILKLKTKGYINPQFHGREHINAQFWLEELRNGNQDYLKAFKLACYAIDAKNSKSYRKNLMAALEYENSNQKIFIEKSIQEGHNIFETTFGFKSKTFIAPRYVWNDGLNEVFLKEGFTHLQTALFQQVSVQKGYQSIFHYTGQRNKNSGIKYLVRNTFFEPAYGGIDWVQSAENKLNLAFKFNVPAIISMHRLNFVGGLDKSARDSHLAQFADLIQRIISNYPEVEFLSSDELANFI